MEEDENNNSDGGVSESAAAKGRTVIAKHDGVVCDGDNPQNKNNHYRSQPPQQGAEFEHVPRHHVPRSERSSLLFPKLDQRIMKAPGSIKILIAITAPLSDRAL